MAASEWKRFFPNGRGLIDGAKLNRIFEGAQKALSMTITTLVSTTATITTATITTLTGTTVNAAMNGTLGATTPAAATVTTLTSSGAHTDTPQIITAAGATQGTATAITTFNAIVTVALTASTKGVKLPTAVTGLCVRVANLATFGVKVYPATNGKIGAAATNVADTVLAINKANLYIAQNTTKWAVLRGA